MSKEKGTCPRTGKLETLDETYGDYYCSGCELKMGNKHKDDRPYLTAKKYFKEHIEEEDFQ